MDGVTGAIQTQLDNKQAADALLAAIAALAFAGNAEKFLAVNSAADDFEFVDAPGGGVEYDVSGGTEDVFQVPNSGGELIDTLLKITGTYQFSFIRAAGSKEIEFLVESAASAIDFKNVYGELRQAATAVMRFYSNNIRFKEPVGIQNGTFFSPDRTLEVRDTTDPPIRISNTSQYVDLGVNGSSQLEANGAQVPALTLTGNGDKFVGVNSAGTAYEFKNAPAAAAGGYGTLSNVSTAATSDSTVLWNNADVDGNVTEYTDTGRHGFEVGADGVYLVHASVPINLLGTANTTATLRLYVNGADLSPVCTSTLFTGAVSPARPVIIPAVLSNCLSLSDGDIVEVYYDQGVGTSQLVTAYGGTFTIVQVA